MGAIPIVYQDNRLSRAVRRELVKMLAEEQGNQAAVARTLKCNPSAITSLLKTFKVKLEEFGGRWRRNSHAKLNPEMLMLARILLLRGETTRMVKEQTGISQGTLWRVLRDVCKQNRNLKCPCGRHRQHLGFCSFRVARSPGRIGWLIGHYKDITDSSKFPPKPRYERPDIENERDTELPMLVKRHSVVALDEVQEFGHRKRAYHEVIGSQELTPLEALIEKEEAC